MHSNSTQKYTIEFKSWAAKYLARLEKKVYEKITFQLLRIAMGFEAGLDIRKMEGWPENLYRLRIGQLRIIYQKVEDRLVILVTKIWPRWDVYK